MDIWASPTWCIIVKSCAPWDLLVLKHTNTTKKSNTKMNIKHTSQRQVWFAYHVELLPMLQ